MEQSAAEKSAQQFGVRLRRVAGTGSDENIDRPPSRRSFPSGPPSRCEARAQLRRSTTGSNITTKSDIRQSQVAARQEAAEKQAIERQKRLSSPSVSSSSDKPSNRLSKSWEKKSKPLSVAKPNYLSRLHSSVPKSSSCSSLDRRSRSSTRTPSLESDTESVEKDSPSVTSRLPEVKEALESNVKSWLDIFHRTYKPMLNSIYLNARDSLQKQTTCLVNYYYQYQKEFDKESRKHRNMRLIRGVDHRHRFLAVGLTSPTWCDLCSGTMWGKNNICLQCIDENRTAQSRSSATRKLNVTPVSKSPSPVERSQRQSQWGDRRYASNSSSSSSSVHSRHSKLSEQDYMTRVLSKMTDKCHDEESDYANLWDSESGSSSSSSSESSRSSFNANQQIMETLMRTKGSDQMERDPTRRNAWRSKDSTPSYSSGGHSSESPCRPLFDPSKLESLRAKADSLDLSLTDYFTDLKHSKSFRDISELCDTIIDSGCKGCGKKVMSASNDCKFTCHQNCEDLLTDQCKGSGVDNSFTKCHTDPLLHCMDDTDSGYSGTPPGGSAGFTLTKEEICTRIKLYNEKVGSNSNGAMTLPTDDSGVFHGCIQVYLSIDRPINMSLSSRPLSIYDTLKRDEEAKPHVSPESTTSPELLPKNAVFSLHINSENSACDVVSLVLKKFKITDNPRSFALFEQTIEGDKEVKLRKIADQEHPLLNFLRWNTESKESKRFVLKENDSGEIMYEAFSLPELNNFLRMLEKEESLFLTEIKNKYLVRRRQMEQRLKDLETQRSQKKRASKSYS